MIFAFDKCNIVSLRNGMQTFPFLKHIQNYNKNILKYALYQFLLDWDLLKNPQAANNPWPNVR